MLLELLVLFISISVLIYVKLLNTNPQPIYNIYQRPNGFYWFKVFFMYTILSLKKLGNKLKKVNENELFKKLDKPQKLSNHEKAIDAVYFNAANSIGDHLVIGTARRKNRLIDGFFYLLVEDSSLGILEFPKVPDTALYQNEDNFEKYEAEGIKLECIEPMKKWRIYYDGKMKQNSNPKNFVDVKIEAEWASVLPYFNFDTDMDSWCMAKGLALERWNRQFFENLKTFHQTHYEQFGQIKGKAIIDGKIYDLNMSSVRDHSFGLKREWENFYRYSLHFFTCENGDRFHIGNICMPICFSQLSIGYVYSAQDQKISALQWCDLQLYQHGENGNAPLDYAFSCQAGGKFYVIQINVKHSPYFYISRDWDSKVIERLCTAKINGKNAWGAAEWEYRNFEGKNIIDFKKME